MQLRIIRVDADRAVSPVIGVILLVAITVLLAATIATFVMSMGTNDTGPANAQLEWTDVTAGSGSTVYFELRMAGGDALPTSEYRVTISHGGSGSPYTTPLDASPASGTIPTDMTAGDSVHFVVEGPPVNAPRPRFDATSLVSSGITAANVDQVELIWESPDSDRTEVVDKWSP